MPSQSYRITEPHPSLPQTHYLHSGRGGAGNFSHVDPKDITAGPDASGPASRTALAQHEGGSTKDRAAASSHYYASGRGGAGNLHHFERPIFSFDEELERQRRMMEHQAPVYHVGRGGAGNTYGTSGMSSNAGDGAVPGMTRRASGGSTSSGSSAGSANSSGIGGAWNRLKGSLTK